jgi:hypothetical protein
LSWFGAVPVCRLKKPSLWVLPLPSNVSISLLPGVGHWQGPVLSAVVMLVCWQLAPSSHRPGHCPLPRGSLARNSIVP